MARPPLELGTAGEFRYYYRIDGRWHPLSAGDPADGVKPDRWRAICQFRDQDGGTRQLERTGTTKAKAVTALRKHIAERNGVEESGTLTAASRVKHAAKLYLKQTREERSGTTYDRYVGRVNNHIVPRMGELLLREVTAGRVNAVISDLRKAGKAPETLRGIRACISGIMQTAIDHDVIGVNPVASARKIEGGSVRAAQAYNREELAAFLAKVDADRIALRSDLPDLLRFMFGTGARFGEALAVRWYDLNLTDEPINVVDPDGKKETIPPRSVFFNGNLVYVKGQGVVRNEGKTASSRGMVGLPDFLVTLLLVRAPAMAAAGLGVMEPVFPSSVLGWRHPANIQRAVRRLRTRIKFPNFTTHVGRKTVATLLAEAGQTSRQVADQLRHSSIAVTEKSYIARGIANPDAATLIDAAHRTS